MEERFAVKQKYENVPAWAHCVDVIVNWLITLVSMQRLDDQWWIRKHHISKQVSNQILLLTHRCFSKNRRTPAAFLCEWSTSTVLYRTLSVFTERTAQSAVLPEKQQEDRCRQMSRRRGSNLEMATRQGAQALVGCSLCTCLVCSYSFICMHT